MVKQFVAIVLIFFTLFSTIGFEWVEMECFAMSSADSEVSCAEESDACCSEETDPGCCSLSTNVFFAPFGFVQHPDEVQFQMSFAQVLPVSFFPEVILPTFASQELVSTYTDPPPRWQPRERLHLIRVLRL